MNGRKRIEELERRVRELEARPVAPTVILYPSPPAVLPWYPWVPTHVPPAWTEPFYVTTSSTVQTS